MTNFSEEHSDFLLKRKNEKKIIFICRLSIIILFLLLWEFLVRCNVINSFLFSSPSKIINTLFNLIKEYHLITHIKITLFEVMISFFISAVFGILISSFLWANDIIFKIIEPYLTILNSLPKVALGPLIIIWFGASIKSIIFMGVIISIFITIINIYMGFISTDKNYVIMLKSFGANKWQVFKYVILPSNVSLIISSLKINMSMNLIGIIMGELLVSKKGLGYLIMYGSQVFNINLVISCIFIIGVLSYIMYLLITKIK